MIRRLVLAAAMAASLASVALPSAAVTYVRVEPPAPRAETALPLRHGYVWAPGYWGWHRNHHVWVAGKWVRERRGHHYNAPVWQQRDGRWYLQRGRWARGDRDGDGVPNGADRHPNDSTRK